MHCLIFVLQVINQIQGYWEEQLQQMFEIRHCSILQRPS